MILRHWDNDYNEAKIRSLPTFDGFVFTNGHGPDVPHIELATEYCANGYRGWSYFNVWTKPPAEWEDPLPPYLALVRAICPPMMEPTQAGGTTPPKPVVAWGGGRELIDWPLMDQRKMIDLALMVRQEARVVPGLYGVFHDLAFRRPRDWMMVPSSVYQLFDPTRWVHGERRFLRFQQICAESHVVISNGDETLPGPVYLEYAERSWDYLLDHWKHGHPDSVLSVNCEDEEAVDKLISAHNTNRNRWIAFSGWDAAATDRAYELAAA